MLLALALFAFLGTVVCWLGFELAVTSKTTGATKDDQQTANGILLIGLGSSFVLGLCWWLFG